MERLRTNEESENFTNKHLLPMTSPQKKSFQNLKRKVGVLNLPRFLVGLALKNNRTGLKRLQKRVNPAAKNQGKKKRGGPKTLPFCVKRGPTKRKAGKEHPYPDKLGKHPGGGRIDRQAKVWEGDKRKAEKNTNPERRREKNRAGPEPPLYG